MITRRLLVRVEERLRQFPGVVLLGPRQVGKTTLARTIAGKKANDAVYLDLERPADRRRLDDPDAYLRSQAGRLVVIDEIHRLPGLFEVLRGIIDDRRAAGERAGQFLLLGSASLDLMKQASESLAGRIAYVELAPIDVSEVEANSRAAARADMNSTTSLAGSLRASLANSRVETLWVRGGFPESLLAPTDAASSTWRHQFVRSYLERDVPMFAPRLPAETIRRLWGMMAHDHGGLLNQARLATSLGVSAPAVTRYLDLLVDLLLVRRLQPWSGNVGKRLVRRPKVYIRDAGILHALLGLETLDDLLGHPVVGPSWEGFAIESLIGAAGEQSTPLFLRTEGGAEIDFLLERGGRVELAVEIKRTTAPTVSKGFRIGCDLVQPREAYVLHGGADTWPMGDSVTAIGLRDLLGRLAGSSSRP